MKITRKKIKVILFAPLLTLAAATYILGQDAAQVDAKHYKVEFENEQVRVVRATYGPNEKSVMHQHPDGLAVSLNNMTGKFTFPDGTMQNRTFKAGQVRWTPAETHLPQNMTAKSFQVILVELKGGSAGTSMPAGAVDPIKADPKRNKVVFENDRVRVLRFTGAPGGKEPMHGHPSSVAISLVNGNLEFTTPDGKSTTAQPKAGQVAWRDPIAHAGRNVGKAPYQSLVVELK